MMTIVKFSLNSTVDFIIYILEKKTLHNNIIIYLMHYFIGYPAQDKNKRSLQQFYSKFY